MNLFIKRFFLYQAHDEGDKGSHAITTDVGQTLKDGSCNKANARNSQVVYQKSVYDHFTVSQDAANVRKIQFLRTVTNAYGQGACGSANIGLFSSLSSVGNVTVKIYQTTGSSSKEDNNSLKNSL